MKFDKKIDFAVLLSVTNANPNGDPLNGNRPRTDYKGFGEISDVCIKRKIRNRMQDLGHEIFVQSDDRRGDDCLSLKDRAKFLEKIKLQDEFARVACETPGVYVPEDCMGKWMKAGEPLGVIIDALEGVTRETVTAPYDGLVFSQRSYSAVYPGTLIARMYIPGKDGGKA